MFSLPLGDRQHDTTQASGVRVPNERLTSQDFNLAVCKLSLFAPDADASPQLFLRHLDPWREAFDGEQQVIPGGAALPPEVPRVILTSRDTGLRADLAPARVDLQWHRLRTATEESTLTHTLGRLAVLAGHYLTSIRPRIGRLACIVTRFAVSDAPGEVLADHFCQPSWRTGAINRPENFELHAHKAYELPSGRMVNSWIRHKTASITINDDSLRAVLVEQDLNTLSEDSPDADFTPEEIDAFFIEVPGQFDEIFSLYYPT